MTGPRWARERYRSYRRMTLCGRFGAMQRTATDWFLEVWHGR